MGEYKLLSPEEVKKQFVEENEDQKINILNELAKNELILNFFKRKNLAAPNLRAIDQQITAVQNARKSMESQLKQIEEMLEYLKV